jgi:hypothetical protein
MRRLPLLVLIGLLAGCNSRDPVLDGPGATPSGPSPAVPALMLAFEPAAVMGGNASQGIVTLAQPAPAGGVVVSVRSGHPAVSVPVSVTVPAGSRTAVFPVTSTSVAVDVNAPVTVSAASGASTGTLVVWSVQPMYLSVVSEENGPFGRSGFRRLTPENSTFLAACTQSDVNIFVSGSDFWTASFGAPRGTPMRPGTYESAVRTSSRTGTSPGLDVGSCNLVRGRFVVHEVSVTRTGGVQRFWATFEQYCDQYPGALRGEVRVINPPIPTTVSSCVVP